MMIRTVLTTLLWLALLPTAHATDSYGYLGFWHHPNQAQSVPQTKTTRENQTEAAAQAEIQQFCAEHDAHLNQPNATGCFALIPIKNTCIAAAWSRKRGLLKPDNLVISIEDDFHRVGKLAQKACRQQFGWSARCEVETVYCTNSEMYQAP